MIDSRDADMRPLRLTAVISSLAMGGAERMMALLTRAWAERGWEVLLITLGSPTLERYFELDPHVEVQHLDLLGQSHGAIDALASNIGRLTTIRAAIRASQPDVVLSFMVDTNVLTILASLGLGMPVVVQEHTDPSVHAIRSAWRLLRRMTYPLAASVIALSPPALAALGPARGRRGRVIPNPVMPPPPGRVVPSDPPVIVAMGRLVRAKGFDMLLDAFARVSGAHPDWRLEIWGEGAARSALEAQRDALSLSDRVTLPGRTDKPYEVLRRASLFVLSSRREGFPTVLGEAMSCGLPVVSVDCPSGPRQLIRDGVDGLLVPPEDVGALVAGMERLIRDRNLARELASRAPQVVERYALSTVLERWDAVFSEVLGGSGGPDGRA